MDSVLAQRTPPARSGSTSPSRRVSGTSSPVASPITPHSPIIEHSHNGSTFMPEDIQLFLRSNPLFQNRASDEFLRELASQMHLRHHQTGDVIVKESEIGRAMFFIVRGSVTVGSLDSDIVLAELGPGNLFGEIGVLFDLPRTATVFAKTKCLLVTLTKAEFQRIADTYPDVSAEIMSEAQTRYAYLLKRGKMRQTLDISRRSSNSSTANVATAVTASSSLDSATLRYYSKLSAYQSCPVEIMSRLRESQIELHRFKSGDLIADIGDQEKRLIIIHSGKVDLIYATPSVGDKSINVTPLITIGAGTFIGASVFLNGAARRERLIASTDSTEGCLIYIITPAEYETLIAPAFPWFADNLRRAADRKQNHFNQSTEDLLILEPTIKESLSGEKLFAEQQQQSDATIASTDGGNLRESSDDSGSSLEPIGRLNPSRRISRSYHQLDEVPENLLSLIDGYNNARDFLRSDPISVQENRITKFRRKSSQNLLDSVDTLLNSERSTSVENSSSNFHLNSPRSLDNLKFIVSSKSPLNETSAFSLQLSDDRQILIKEPESEEPLSGARKSSKDIQASSTADLGNDGLQISIIPENSNDNSSQDVADDDTDEKELHDGFHDRQLPYSLLSPHISLADPKRRRASVAVWADSTLSAIASQKAATAEFSSQPASHLKVITSRLAIVDLKQSLCSLKSSLDELNSSAESIADDEFATSPFQSAKLVAQIAKYLPFKSLWRLRGVNTCSFKALQTPQFMTIIDLSSSNRIIDDQSLEYISRYAGDSLEVLVLKNCWKCTNTTLKHLSTHSKNLEVLDACGAWDITDEGLITLSHGCRRLKAIDLSNCRKITDNGLSSLLTNCSALCDVFLSYCKCLSDNTMVTISNHSPAIRRLNFQRCLGITDFGFRQLNVTAYPKLQELILSDCSFLTDSAMQDLSACCPNLHHLNISFCCALTELSFEYLTQGCTRLAILDASFCGTAVTDRILAHISSELQCLERLSVRGCVQVTAQGLAALKANAKWLTTLNISGCKNIAQEAAKSLPPEWTLLSAQSPLVEPIGVTGSRQIGSTHVRRFTSP